MIRRLLDRLVPADALTGIGRVGWRLVDDADPHVLTAAGGFCAPFLSHLDLLNDGAPPNWRRWPSVKDLLPVFSAPRGGIRFIEPPRLRGVNS